ncbi:MAG: hypothetical protein KC478_15825, partial [Bacteriovoracaceae bacterium]|nr:hypothetical protein [Bacteriovoracaceae bacterium]
DTKYRKKQRLDTDVHKTGILRLERELSKAQKLELVRELREDAYKDVLKSFSTVGNNIYIEMKTSGSFNRFDELIEQRHGQISNLGVRKFERCSVNLCANLETTNSNLVPLLEKSNQLRFDTFFSIKKLEMNDFKYNGFIELEFKLNLGV